MNEKILDVKNLCFSFDTYVGEVQAVRGVSFSVNKKEVFAIVGESGSGKSITVQSLLKIVPMPPGRLKSGIINYNGEEISKYTDKQMENIRGKEISMIFQDPMTSLNPTMRIGTQIVEGIRKHEKIQANIASEKAVEMLGKVGIPNANKNIFRYPHMFSGGMRQRIMIAMALACNPKILIADEPTTALDVTTQAQILELMNDLRNEFNTSIILITHDLGIVARMADKIAVMYAGKIIETGTATDIFYNSMHPYTWGLISSLPKKGKKESKKLVAIPGSPPDLFSPPKGCGFASRCKYCMEICRTDEPCESEVEKGHLVSCWLLDERAPKVEIPCEVRKNKKEDE